jgi:hypothetical protein
MHYPLNGRITTLVVILFFSPFSVVYCLFMVEIGKSCNKFRKACLILTVFYERKYLKNLIITVTMTNIIIVGLNNTELRGDG